MTNRERIIALKENKKLSHENWAGLIGSFTEEDREYAAKIAEQITLQNFGNKVFFRGIIEFSNVCKNDCYYCGIRCSNKNVVRYTLTPDEILLCCEEGYRLGYRTFVLQSGEDKFRLSTDFIELIREVKRRFNNSAITLSVGECDRETYRAMFQAGADRYLLRHETADKDHYGKLHPEKMSFDNRMRCLKDLKEIGFQTGCGMMVGTPWQTPETLAKDMEFMSEFKPEMVGIGPFIPHKDTPFKDAVTGSQELTLFLLSLTRIMLPNALLPATTALGTASSDGRINGVFAGCNVVMPNLSPENVRKKYLLYDNKAGIDMNAEESLNLLKDQMKSIGREVVIDKGDYKELS